MDAAVIRRVASQRDGEGRGGWCEAETARQCVNEKRDEQSMRGKQGSETTTLQVWTIISGSFRYLWLTQFSTMTVSILSYLLNKDKSIFNQFCIR